MLAKAGEIVRKLFSEPKKNDLCYIVAKLLVKLLLLHIMLSEKSQSQKSHIIL